MSQNMNTQGNDDKIVSEELKAILEEAKQKYGFDFKADKPIDSGKSRFVWYPTNAKDVPSVYRPYSAADAKLKSVQKK